MKLKEEDVKLIWTGVIQNLKPDNQSEELRKAESDLNDAVDKITDPNLRFEIDGLIGGVECLAMREGFFLGFDYNL